LFLHRAGDRRGARVEHEQRGFVLLDHGAGSRRVGSVGDHRGERRTQFPVHVRQRLGGARDAHDPVTPLDKRGRDRRPETAASARNHRRGLRLPR
jgi:hypothetical protein